MTIACPSRAAKWTVVCVNLDWGADVWTKDFSYMHIGDVSIEIFPVACHRKPKLN